MGASIHFGVQKSGESQVAFLVCPRGCISRHIGPKCQPILESSALIVRQYDASEDDDGDKALAEVVAWNHSKATVLALSRKLPGAGEHDTTGAVVVRTRSNQCILICPVGSKLLLPEQFTSCLKECRGLWIALYQPRHPRSTREMRGLLRAWFLRRRAGFSQFNL